MNLRIIIGPIIGAVIGYFTNYLAVKMLFRPLKPVMIGKFRLPFTPGIIPKGQKRLAKAFGNVVGGKLVTEQDIIKTLLSDDIQKSIENEVVEILYNSKNSRTLLEVACSLDVDNPKFVNITNNISSIITDRIFNSISKMDLGHLIATEGSKAIKEKVEGSFLAMMVNDKLIASFAEPISDSVNKYIEYNGKELIFPYVNLEVENISNKSITELVTDLEINESDLRNIINKLYKSFINDKAAQLLNKLNLSNIVETKINEMDVLEIEDLLLSVIKNELNAIVNLGAPIGFVIGLINIIF